MSREQDNGYRKPSETMFFHFNNEELEQHFPEWYERHRNSGKDGFNSQYSTDAPEIEMNYDPEVINLSFGPIIDTLRQQINPLQNSRILEIGGASGLLAKNLQDRGAKMTLLETQKNFVEKARERGVVDARIYNGTDLTKSFSANEKYHAVIANRVFEDIVMSENQAKIIMKQVKNVLEPNGFLIVGTQRPEAVWLQAIARSSQLKLIKSLGFPNNYYIQQVLVFG